MQPKRLEPGSTPFRPHFKDRLPTKKDFLLEIPSLWSLSVILNFQIQVSIFFFCNTFSLHIFETGLPAFMDGMINVAKNC